ncbi:hypothetical protein PF005_g20059 [Phytophthora fragariae]|uniref:RxLR effector protein n=1 Tax=Phytophthora fragariae TaxID=53985 RepID=A0A6A3J0W6_9STRA|nr:hypothetical protein PF003_g938 [Phytophthora fragariae]KAE8929020.1 hypothetical protein PF009_g20857 [Phytophthora fragariae]KAE8988886.1 hypothetical protein PF011_g18996 [Phytophthora fragariae]KAE9087513.1 hypothetical protein PF007_g20352 [Phytophthora fragariae]KAE9087951.1 hypothetical protein PF010_g19542 [Phytophthora fragariae]
MGHLDSRLPQIFCSCWLITACACIPCAQARRRASRLHSSLQLSSSSPSTRSAVLLVPVSACRRNLDLQQNQQVDEVQIPPR